MMFFHSSIRCVLSFSVRLPSGLGAEVGLHPDVPGQLSISDPTGLSALRTASPAAAAAAAAAHTGGSGSGERLRQGQRSHTSQHTPNISMYTEIN